ncbi:MAG: UDP-4-amino-4,6-dideoxy-N-acetyl-beta-L-altrosamine N-acetyltransferase [Pseudomonadota bacterium]
MQEAAIISDLTTSHLREVSEQDLEMLLCWRNHSSVSQYMYHQNTITMDEHLRWYARTQKNPLTANYIFEHRDKPSGFVSLSRYSWANIGEWGFYIAPEADKGTGRALAEVTLKHFFENLQMDKINAEVIDYNTRSINYHKRLGFVEEGFRKNYYVKNNVFYDILFFGLKQSDYLETQKNASA